MCGIAALLGDLPSDQIETSLRGMLDAQAHRGPDDTGSVLIPTGGAMLGLGSRRLAIQDISALGHQPMRNENTGDVLVYNGEIYNAPELKAMLQSAGYCFRGHSDTEVLLRAYEQWGLDCLDRLRVSVADSVLTFEIATTPAISSRRVGHGRRQRWVVEHRQFPSRSREPREGLDGCTLAQ